TARSPVRRWRAPSRVPYRRGPAGARKLHVRAVGGGGGVGGRLVNCHVWRPPPREHVPEAAASRRRLGVRHRTRPKRIASGQVMHLVAPPPSPQRGANLSPSASIAPGPRARSIARTPDHVRA